MRLNDANYVLTVDLGTSGSKVEYVRALTAREGGMAPVYGLAGSLPLRGGL